MGRKLSPNELELYRRVDEVLHYLWDPIGVAGVLEARDEYYAYLPHVYSLLISHGTSDDIVEFLVATETEHMGLSSMDSARERARKIVRLLERYRDDIRSRTSSA